MWSASLTHSIAIKEADVYLEEEFSGGGPHGSSPCDHSLAMLKAEAHLYLIKQFFGDEPSSRGRFSMDLCKGSFSPYAHRPV
jgi:hypothetical protein